LRDALAGSKELWICYYCGECSDSCPREAEPGEFMAAARRYAIASNDVTGIGRLLYSSVLGGVAVFLIVTALLLWYLLAGAGPVNGRFFEFISGHTVHNAGLIVIGIAVIAMALGVINMFRRINIATRYSFSRGDKASMVTKFSRGVSAVVSEIITQKRYRDCSAEYAKPEPWYRPRWFVHWAMLWGFIGLFVATVWVFLDKLPDGAAVPLYYPSRLIGIVAGLFFVYGTSMALVERLSPTSKYGAHSHSSDWTLLLYLFLLGITGFILTFMVYLAPATVFGNIILLAHMVLAFQLVLLLPFSKLAHVVYRSLAIFVHAYRGTEALAPAAEQVGAA